MKISFLTSTSAPTPYKEYYSVIINYLIRRGHSVSHILSMNEKKEDLFFNFYKDIRESDLVIAECSFPSINIGYEISLSLQEEKEVIILKSKESGISFKISDPLFNDKNICIYEYDKNNLFSVLKEALGYNTPKKYRKFNVLFSPAMVAKLNHISKKKNLPKSVGRSNRAFSILKFTV